MSESTDVDAPTGCADDQSDLGLAIERFVNGADAAAECSALLSRACNLHDLKELALANMSDCERECRLWWDRTAVVTAIYPNGDARFERYLERNGWGLIDDVVLHGFLEHIRW